MSFAIFIVIGSVKGNPYLASINDRVDLTLGAFAISLLFSFARLPKLVKRFQYRISLYLMIYLLLMLWIGFVFLFNENVDSALEKLQRVYVFTTWSLLAGLIVIRSSIEIERFFRCFFVCILVICALSIINISTQGIGAHALLGIAGESSESYQTLGILGGAGLTLSCSYLLMGRQLGQRAKYVGAAVLFAVVAFLSGTRQAFLGFISGVIVFILTNLQSGFFTRRIWVVALSTIVISLGFLVIMNYIHMDYRSSRASERMYRAMQGENITSPGSRRAIWRESLDMCMERPLLGWGLESLKTRNMMNVADPHNYFLELWQELGLIGLILGFFLQAIPVYTYLIYTRVSISPIWIIVGMFYAYNLSRAMVAGDLASNRFLFFSAGLVMSASALVDRYRFPYYRRQP